MRKLVLLFVLTTLLFTGCSQTSTIIDNNEIDARSWDLYLDSGENTKVVLAHTYDDPDIIEWISNDFTDSLMANHGIELQVYNGSQNEIFDQIEEEMEVESSDSLFDIILLEKDGFKIAYENEYLYGPFTEELPNFNSKLNPIEFENVYDEGIEIAGYELPFAKRQLIFICNEKILYEKPETYENMFEIADVMEGVVTYPEPSSEVGEAFLMSYVASNVGYKKLSDVEKTKEAVYELIKEPLKELDDIEDDLYAKGKEYPKSQKELDDLFFEGQILYSMALQHDYATEKMSEYEYPDQSFSFMITDGTTGYVDYAAVVSNASNKSGAMVAINHLISPEIQGQLYDSDNYGSLPVYDSNFADEADYEPIDEVRVKSESLKYDEVLDSRIPEIDKEIRDIVVELWYEHVFDN